MGEICARDEINIDYLVALSFIYRNNSKFSSIDALMKLTREGKETCMLLEILNVACKTEIVIAVKRKIS